MRTSATRCSPPSPHSPRPATARERPGPPTRTEGTEYVTLSPAVLVLEDGARYTGRAYGALGRTLGEAVFATGMTGYQETITDPSYAGQIVLQTAPHIGNTGVNDEDPESRDRKSTRLKSSHANISYAVFCL